MVMSKVNVGSPDTSTAAGWLSRQYDMLNPITLPGFITTVGGPEGTKTAIMCDKFPN
jgi:hypothetical protein